MRFNLARSLGLIVLVSSASLSGADADTRLVDAVKGGNRALVRTLLQQKVDVNVAQPDGMTALHWAVTGNDGDMVRLLLQAGANAKAASRYGVTPLFLAATNGSAVIAAALVKAGADPNGVLPAGETVLIRAARTGSTDTIKVLVAAGAKVNAAEPWRGQTPLMFAAAENHAAAVTVLLELGADANAKAKALYSSSESGASGGNGAARGDLPKGEFTALMYAARDGAVEAIRALASKADLNLTDPDGTTALVFAIINGHFDTAAALLEHGADPNVADSTGVAALYSAVDMHTLAPMIGLPAPELRDSIDAVELVRLLLAKGADPNARLLSRALRRHTAHSDPTLEKGSTALARAAKSNDVPVMQLLLKAGADPFLTPQAGTSTVMFAAMGDTGFTYPVSSANRVYTGNRPSAEHVTATDSVAAVKLLLDAGVDINAFNHTGTALHSAAARGADPLIKYLVERGARLDLKDKLGRTPLDVALTAGNREKDHFQRIEAFTSTVALLRDSLARAATSSGPSAVGRDVPSSVEAKPVQLVVRTAWEGVYTEAQASRGKAKIRQCHFCHNPDLSAGGQGPALKGTSFLSHYETVGRLWIKLRDEMPPQGWGAPTEDEELDLLAYILQGNGYPPGKEPVTADLVKLDNTWMTKNADGVEPPNFALVTLVGCVMQRPQKEWALTNASAPALTSEAVSDKGALAVAGAQALGNGTFHLANVNPSLNPAPHQGQKVEARGIWYKSPGDNRLNLTSLQPVGGTCTNVGADARR